MSEDPTITPHPKHASILSRTSRRAQTEAEVGITEYLCHDFPGFRGVIKKRFKDFIVHEVDTTGTVIRLTKLTQKLTKKLTNDRYQYLPQPYGKPVTLGHNTLPDTTLVCKGLQQISSAAGETAANQVEAMLVGAKLFTRPQGTCMEKSAGEKESGGEVCMGDIREVGGGKSGKLEEEKGGERKEVVGKKDSIDMVVKERNVDRIVDDRDVDKEEDIASPQGRKGDKLGYQMQGDSAVNVEQIGANLRPIVGGNAPENDANAAKLERLDCVSEATMKEEMDPRIARDKQPLQQPSGNQSIDTFTYMSSFSSATASNDSHVGTSSTVKGSSSNMSSPTVSPSKPTSSENNQASSASLQFTVTRGRSSAASPVPDASNTSSAASPSSMSSPVSKAGTKAPSMCILPAEPDKAKRTHLHTIFREHFGGKLVTDTVNLDPSKSGADRVLAVRVVLHNKTTIAPSNSNRNPNKRKRDSTSGKKDLKDGEEQGRHKARRKGGKIEVDWRSARSSGKGISRTRVERRAKFLQFVLMKENVETHYVANKICRFIGDRRCKLTTAGTKDKRGVTTQKVVVTNCTADQVLRSVAKGFQRGNVVVGNFKDARSALRLGDLLGNRFLIVLRDVAAIKESEQGSLRENVEGRLEALRKQGFINYFGMQRFGSRKVATFMIGRQVVNGDMQAACELVLKEDSNDKASVLQAKELYKSGAALEEVIRAMPFFMTAETAILKGMQEHGRENFELAFKQVPWSLRTLYTHSYQSFVWNHMVSMRIRMNSQSILPVVGDLVLLPPESEHKNGAKGNPERPSSKDAKVKSLTEEDIASGKYTMADVVMPLPGYDVSYPEHAVGKLAYKEFIEKDGANFSFFAERKGAYRLPGSYRKIIAVPKDFEYEWIEYEDDEVDLALSDLDILNGKKLEVKPGQRLALKCGFQLPQSTYATMLLREVMLTTTGIDAIRT